MMKHFAALAIFLCFIITSCRNNKEIDVPFSNKLLPIETFVVNPIKDTILTTSNGAIISIPRGSLQTPGDKPAKLEIREAYSMRQIIEAQLFTQTDGEPLSSGGMIYINAAGGENVTLKGNIKVALPTDFIKEGMQLYKGKLQPGGKINWQEPSPLPPSKRQTAVTNGRLLFSTKCATCHSIEKEFTGPALAHFPKRFPKENPNNLKYYFHLLKAISDTASSSYYSAYDPAYELYQCNLIRRYQSVGTSFPELSDSVYFDIFRYVQNESDRLSLPLPEQNPLKDCVDSCITYHTKKATLTRLQQFSIIKRKKLLAENGPMVVQQTPMGRLLPTNPNPLWEELVNPSYNSATYYQFTIDTFGWYNIDILLKDVDGVKDSELFVRITGNYPERIRVSLIIPSKKVYANGGPTDRGTDTYAFYKKNGHINLPQEEQAYILAFTETDGRIAYSIQAFKTSLTQQFDIQLQETSKEAFTTAMKMFDKQDMRIKVEASKNAAALKINDSSLKEIQNALNEAEQLKPKGCDCNCSSEPPMEISLPQSVSIDDVDALQ